MISKKFEVSDFADLWALRWILKQKLAFADKNQAQLTCFQQSDVKTSFGSWLGILIHCDHAWPITKHIGFDQQTQDQFLGQPNFFSIEEMANFINLSWLH